MAGQNAYPPDRLEDQLRRMILNGPSPTGPSNGMQEPSRPTVRLPHSSTQQHPQQFPSNATQLTDPGMTAFAEPSSPASGAHVNRSSMYRNDHPSAQWNPPQGPAFDGRDHGQHYHRGNRGFHRGMYHHHFANHDVVHAANQVPGPLQQRARHHQQVTLDPQAFQRNGFGPRQHGQYHDQRHLFNPGHAGPPTGPSNHDYHTRQVQYLEQVAATQIKDVEMSQAEHDAKEGFRLALQRILFEVCASDPEHFPEVSLECFGSFKSGFATKGSDMDLVIVTKDVDSAPDCFALDERDLPRALEKRLLELGIGARLLSKTRVPIIKICELPSPDLLAKLREERQNWDGLPEEKKYPHLHYNDGSADVDIEEAAPTEEVVDQGEVLNDVSQVAANSSESRIANPESHSSSNPARLESPANDANDHETTAGGLRPPRVHRRPEKAWTRERNAGPLDYPKEGVGIQCDINFFNPLGLHNTQMLRCYSLCDPRVRPLVLFIKAWAKRRKINSSYSGTLSSYGYVLMMLHYLVNIANPPVLPNLQSTWRPMGPYTPAAAETVQVNGWHVSFWNDEEQILRAARNGHLTANREPLGSLLAGFFQYYSSQGPGAQFRWMQQVLSLRSTRGVLSKEEKGWVKATTEQSDGRKVHQRYLFCIEDPFELAHNVARTVSHNGIVAIRDEFRRARRILHGAGQGNMRLEGDLFDELLEDDGDGPAADQGPHAKPSGPPGIAVTPQAQNTGGSNAVLDNNTRRAQSGEGLPAQRGHRGRGGRGRGLHHGGGPMRSVESVDVADSNAFPALGSPASKPGHRGGHHSHRGGGSFRGRGKVNPTEMANRPSV